MARKCNCDVAILRLRAMNFLL